MTDNEKYIEDAYGCLVGRTIIGVREMVESEMQMMAWSTDPNAPAGVIFVLDDQSIVVPLSDPEGNDPGFLMVQ